MLHIYLHSNYMPAFLVCPALFLYVCFRKNFETSLEQTIFPEILSNIYTFFWWIKKLSRKTWRLLNYIFTIRDFIGLREFKVLRVGNLFCKYFLNTLKHIDLCMFLLKIFNKLSLTIRGKWHHSQHVVIEIFVNQLVTKSQAILRWPYKYLHQIRLSNIFLAIYLRFI